MWRFPRLNFIRIHYAWILFCSLLAFPVLYPYGNLAAIDALFFGCSGSTESGLNTVDLKNLKTYQQVYLYIIPVITNLMFINAMVVPVRLYWFRKRLDESISQTTPDPELGDAKKMNIQDDEAEAEGEERIKDQDNEAPALRAAPLQNLDSTTSARDDGRDGSPTDENAGPRPPPTADSLPPQSTPFRKYASASSSGRTHQRTAITFSEDVGPSRSEGKALRIPSPREVDNGSPFIELDSIKPHGNVDDEDPDAIKPVHRTPTGQSLRRTFTGQSLSRERTEKTVTHAARSIERVASSVFVLGDDRPPRRSRSMTRQQSRLRISNLPTLSRYVTVGKNSTFFNMTEKDRELLGGIEYRALKLLMYFVFGIFIALHLFGVVTLLPWIHHAPSKYTDWLEESGIGRTWWAVYSAQTMANNLGFTLTPDSMAMFKDATWPMLVMTFLAFAGNTCYPILLRFSIWITYKLVRKESETKQSLQFLLDHPRRCYTLLFPSRPTWILLGIIFVLNFVDVLLIIILDLDNTAVNDLPMGPRILSALFQAASARHTGTSTLNLAEVNPAVQFSLLVMMYIAVFPIAISIRASNTYEDRTVAIFGSLEADPDETNSRTYIATHIRNQLTFDLWYIFIGTFLVCIPEAKRIADTSEPSFNIFAVLFEVTSAYGNVGLSLGGPLGNTSMSGHYSTLAKFIICAMMIRGRHRGLPYALDRAITLPNDIVGPRGEEPQNGYRDAPPTDVTLQPTKAIPAVDKPR